VTRFHPIHPRYRAAAIGAGIVGALIVIPLVIVSGTSGTSRHGFSVWSASDSRCAAPGTSSTREFRPTGIKLSTGPVAKSTVDDTSAIQDAINAASAAGGGIVSLPAGTFVIDGHLRLKNNVELIGVGPDTVLKAGPRFLDSTGPEGGYPLLTTSGAVNVTMANLTADQSGDILDAGSYPARLSAYLVDVRDSRNVVVDGVSTRNPFTYSIAVVGSTDFCITHCRTRVATSGRYNGLDGIHILDSNTGQVIYNYVDQREGRDGDDGLVAHTIDAPVYNVLYADNTVRGGNDGDGMQLAVGNYPIYNIVVRDNNFWGSPYGIRTGYWNSGTHGAVHNIAINGNYIHDLVPGKAFPDGGDAINIGGFGAIAPVTQITVTDNITCKAGIITVVQGTGNTVVGNRVCAGGSQESLRLSAGAWRGRCA
jgi:polygalacturonase